jgi:fused signal recognition particle receptor
MLGWFKKKFAKKADDVPAEQPPDAGPLPVEEEVLHAESPETPEPAQPAPPEVEPAAAEPLPETRARDVAEEPEPPAKPEKKAQKSDEAPVSFFKRLAEKLSKTREAFTYQLDSLFLGRKVIDAELFDDLEELLITADLGAATTREVLDHARRRVSRKELSDPESLKVALKEKIKSFITDSQRDAELVMPETGPFVIMVIGVNGVGKTTTIGKIANKFVKAGSSVMLVAGDTFRAAAVSQLQIWGERTGVHVVARADGADPSSVVYDAMDIARAKNYDVVLVDTAGRLHTQTNLMEELKKIKRVMGKRLEGAPHEVMLVIDATTGQNGISQAKLFHEAVGITGITLTKLDGTAKGGIVANICREMRTPIRFIGVGEKMEDLRDFDPDEFIEALFEARLP